LAVLHEAESNMAYDEALAQKVRTYLQGNALVTESRQFGGIGFLVRGNMAVGVLGSDLLVRVGPDRHDEAMKSPHAKPFALTGRPAKGWLLVKPAGLKNAPSLRKWVELGLAFAVTLPAK
jgi:TfoX/Sxy family transcriptional regulator of competence genes